MKPEAPKSKKYIACLMWQEIKLVEIEKESDSCVWVQGRRKLKKSDYESYHDTEERAKECLIDDAESKVDSAERALIHAKAKLEKAQAAKI